MKIKTRPLENKKSAAEAELSEAVIEFKAAKAALDAAKDLYDKAQHRLVTIMRDRGEKSTTTDIGDRSYQVTIVTSERTKVDESGLRNAIGDVRFATLCDQKLSLAKVDHAIKRGEIDLTVFAEYAQMVETSPYIKVTETNDTTT